MNVWKVRSVMLLLPVLAVLFFTSDVCSQVFTQKEQLLQLSAEWQKISLEKKATAEIYARTHNIPVRVETPEGNIIELQFVEDGVPYYYITENTNAAATTRTNRLWPGGQLGLSLSGNGFTGLGEWDGGAVRSTHQEFNQTGSSRVTQMDGATTESAHSTHVAGTMIAGGVSASAKGMAGQASLKAWEWNSDISEMAAAAADGLLISNHSYGYARGWTYNCGVWTWYGNVNISTQEDYLFGFYNNSSRSWDQVAYNAPYYLIVKSAGNDRLEGPVGGEYPADGYPDGYDCIGDVGVAKNILTVGAVNDVTNYTGPASVVMSSFSCFGPADDGRIKPDIVANGVSLYSSVAGGNNAYSLFTGTSMAAPNTSGTLVLLQQHYQNTHNGASMRAATLKALVIHTADECGSTTGPDYRFGWGLLNAANAANKITQDAQGPDNVIDELVLNNGGTYLREITVDGSQPLVVTVCWTDPAGTPVAASLDPINPMLVNDLDLRITKDGTTHNPWKLDRDNPAAAATSNGENNADNVEMVYIANPASGTYTITVDHDGTLAAPQAFSIVLSGTGSGAPPPPPAPVANFNANSTQVYAGATVNFTDLSTNGPTSWAWSFTGGTPASSTLQHPSVTYNTSGTYTVSLTATNAGGSDTETKTGYITVLEAPPAGYCSSHGNASLEWVKTVKVGSFTYNSGSSGSNGYSDFTGQVISLQAGSTYSSTFTPGFSGPAKSEYWRVWIDFNQDDDFNDSGELVFSRNKMKVATTANIIIPADALPGETRMRVSMKRNSGATSCEVFASGEVEDYTVNITQGGNGPLAQDPIQAYATGDSPFVVSVYPIPVIDNVYLGIQGGTDNTKVSLFDLQGRLIMEQMAETSPAVLDLSMLQSGVYLLKVSNGKETILKKLIKN